MAGVEPETQVIRLSGEDVSEGYEVVGQSVKVVASSKTALGGSSEQTHSSRLVKTSIIANQVWEQAYYNGKLIASNDTYFAYAVRGKGGHMVRVINQMTTSRALLKGLLGPVADMAFAHDKSNLLAVVDSLGNLFIWEIKDAGENGISYPVVLILHAATPAPDGEIQLLSWAPEVAALPKKIDEGDDELSGYLAVVHGSTVEVYDLDMACSAQINDDPTPRENLLHGVSTITHHENPTQIYDISLSPDAAVLATASADGHVRFWQIDQTTYKEPNCLHNWQPHDGAAVSCVLFCDNKVSTNPDESFWRFVVTGAERKRILKIWCTIQWTCLQTITFEPQLDGAGGSSIMGAFSPCLQLAMDKSGAYLVISDVNRKVLYVLHIEQNSDENFCKVVRLMEFVLSQPILSFTLTSSEHAEISSPPSTGAEDGRSEGLRLCTLSPKAIQELSAVLFPSESRRSSTAQNTDGDGSSDRLMETGSGEARGVVESTASIVSGATSDDLKYELLAAAESSLDSSLVGPMLTSQLNTSDLGLSADDASPSLTSDLNLTQISPIPQATAGSDSFLDNHSLGSPSNTTGDDGSELLTPAAFGPLSPSMSLPAGMVGHASPVEANSSLSSLASSSMLPLGQTIPDGGTSNRSASPLMSMPGKGTTSPVVCSTSMPTAPIGGLQSSFLPNMPMPAPQPQAAVPAGLPMRPLNPAAVIGGLHGMQPLASSTLSSISPPSSILASGIVGFSSPNVVDLTPSHTVVAGSGLSSAGTGQLPSAAGQVRAGSLSPSLPTSRSESTQVLSADDDSQDGNGQNDASEEDVIVVEEVDDDNDDDSDEDGEEEGSNDVDEEGEEMIDVHATSDDADNDSVGYADSGAGAVRKEEENVANVLRDSPQLNIGLLPKDEQERILHATLDDASRHTRSAQMIRPGGPGHAPLLGGPAAPPEANRVALTGVGATQPRFTTEQTKEMRMSLEAMQCDDSIDSACSETSTNRNGVPGDMLNLQRRLGGASASLADSGNDETSQPHTPSHRRRKSRNRRPKHPATPASATMAAAASAAQQQEVSDGDVQRTRDWVDMGARSNLAANHSEILELMREQQAQIGNLRDEVRQLAERNATQAEALHGLGSTVQRVQQESQTNWSSIRNELKVGNKQQQEANLQLPKSTAVLLQTKIEKSLRTEVKATLVPALDRQMASAPKQAMEGMFASLDSAMSESTVKTMKSKPVAEAVGSVLASECIPQLKQLWRNSFDAHVVPSMQSAIANMMGQVNGSLQMCSAEYIKQVQASPLNAKKVVDEQFARCMSALASHKDECADISRKQAETAAALAAMPGQLMARVQQATGDVVAKAMERAQDTMVKQVQSDVTQLLQSHLNNIRQVMVTQVTQSVSQAVASQQASPQQQQLQATAMQQHMGVLMQQVSTQMQQYEKRQEAQGAQLLASVQKSVQELAQSVTLMQQQLQQQQQQQQQQLQGVAAPGESALDPNNAQLVQRQQQPEERLMQLLQQGEYERAFNEALSMSSLQYVVYVCKVVPNETLFPQSGQCPLSQQILLSLIQQLSSDLTTDVQLKVEYLVGALAALETTNSVIVRYGGKIMERLAAAVDAASPSFPELNHQFRLLKMAARNIK